MASLYADDALEAGFQTAAQEKEPLMQGQATSAGLRSPEAPRENMPSVRHLVATLLVCFLVTFGLATVIAPKPWHRQPCHDKGRETVQPGPEMDESAFRHLVNTVSQESLHDLLHKYFPNRYQHGVYPSDHSAIEAVHRDNAALATSIVHMAKRDNTTTTPTSDLPPPTSNPTTTPTVPPTTSNPPPTTSDNPPPNSSKPPTTKPTTPPGTLTDNPSSIVPPVSSTSSSSASMVPSLTGLTSHTGSTTTPKTLNTSKTSKLTTSTYTSTINGQPTVVVATSYVEVVPQESGTTTGPNGSLQTNAAAIGKGCANFGAVIGAVIGGAILV